MEVRAPAYITERIIFSSHPYLWGLKEEILKSLSLLGSFISQEIKPL